MPDPTPFPRRVTIKDVAAQAGVSHTTVSRALRNDRRISDVTRGRIRELAQKLGYRPDPAVTAMVAQRNRQRPPTDYRKIAVLDAWNHARGENPYYLEPQLRGMRSRAHELGYDVEVFPLGREVVAHQRLSRVLVARGIRGVVVAGLPSDFPLVQLGWENFSAVALGYSVNPVSLHNVGNDHVAAVNLAYQKLRAAGYQRIGYFNRLGSEERNHHLHVGAYLKCVLVDGVPFDQVPPLLFKDHEPLRAADWVRRFGFDAVVCGYHTTLRDEVEKKGIRVPEDLAIVGFGLRPGDLEFSGIQDDAETVGRRALDLLHTMLVTGEMGIPTQEFFIAVKGIWQEGNTMLRQR